MQKEINCIRCGREARKNERVDPGATWWLCKDCSFEFGQARPDELVEWHREALRKYAETGNKAYLNFARNFLEPCIPGSKLLNLKAVRQKHGFSTRELAEKLGVDHSFIIRVEQGRKPLPDRLYKKLVRFNLI
ncbi:MAG: helix-turn-helix domain-containing protein [Candidatus Desulfofervidaceae bacterium]|nr:helix-turn-helix domain-containing protein [Candidatus Desulfofervidaceae bacterium]